MFTARHNRNSFEAGFAQLALIYHQTVHELRKGHANALVGLLMTAMQSVVMIAGFMVLFLLLGMRSSPVQGGDYLIFMMTGIFMFMAHTQTLGAVANSTKAGQMMLNHAPMTTAVLISASALAVLYRQIFACVIILTVYYCFKPFVIEYPVATFSMLILAWASGVAIGVVLLALRPWAPGLANILTLVFQRANMVFSGKMFLASQMPDIFLKMFLWNPLFHVIDQARGFAFVNYSATKTNLAYPIYFTIAVVMIGLIGEFLTRKSQSLSWGAGK